LSRTDSAPGFRTDGSRRSGGFGEPPKLKRRRRVRPADAGLGPSTAGSGSPGLGGLPLGHQSPLG
jgi:hypothetical protein